MNVYFFVEGKTERKVYPAWLSFLTPLNRVNQAASVSQNTYYLFHTGGYPQLYNHLENAVLEINEIAKFQYFVICLDADDCTIEERTAEIEAKFQEKQLTLQHGCQLKIIIQNRCIETWFLGNAKIYKQNPDDELLRAYLRFYDIGNNDPELMLKPNQFSNSIAQFHAEYLRLFLQERNVFYTKEYPREVVEKYYFDELKKRFETTGHIASFGSFVDFVNNCLNT